jgi:hypothetical protein
LCEGYLGIKPHIELWWYFFSVSLLKKREKIRPGLSVPMGCMSIHLQSNRAAEYMALLIEVQQGVACALVLPEE